MKAKVLMFETAEEVSERAAEAFAAVVKKTLAERDRFTVALSGGLTPKLFFTRLSQEPYRSEIAWNKVWVFWGDERSVPPDHPESNYGMARQFLLDKVGISNAHVFRIHGEDPPAESARTYAKVLHDVFKTEPDWPTLDLIILGMGADGHTASLMPSTAALDEERRWVVENVIRSLQTVRITVTLPVINHARNVWFLVTGAKKHAAYECVLDGPKPECPASLVVPENGELVWYVDKTVVEGAAEPQKDQVK